LLKAQYPHGNKEPEMKEIDWSGFKPSIRREELLPRATTDELISAIEALRATSYGSPQWVIAVNRLHETNFRGRRRASSQFSKENQ
jgi:hypothetical protein